MYSYAQIDVDFHVESFSDFIFMGGNGELVELFSQLHTKVSLFGRERTYTEQTKGKPKDYNFFFFLTFFFFILSFTCVSIAFYFLFSQSLVDMCLVVKPTTIQSFSTGSSARTIRPFIFDAPESFVPYVVKLMAEIIVSTRRPNRRNK